MIRDILASGSRDETYQYILESYTQAGYTIVSFLYFANMMHQRLLEPASMTQDQQIYADALDQADFLLPDGIALQVFSKRGWNQPLHNLNGTDFIPYMLDRLAATGQKVHLAIVSVYDPKLGKGPERAAAATSYMEERRPAMDIHLHQDLYTQRGTGFDRNTYQAALSNTSYDVRILLVCTGTPHQEVWTMQMQEKIEELGLLVFNAGGIIDYRSGFESRAPGRVKQARVLETFWRIAQHPQKNFKKLVRMFGILRYRWNKW